MRILVAKPDGTVKSEHLWRLRKPFIELEGEVYPVNLEAVYTHKRHAKEPIILVWQGITDWEGASPQASRTSAKMKMIEIHKQHDQPVRISKGWARSFLYGAEFFFKLMALAYLVGFSWLMVWWLVLL